MKPLLLFCFMIFSATNMVAGKNRDLTAVNFKLLRENMVKRQIQARGVKDESVLRVMRKVERHKFVPTSVRHLAYEDTPLPIGHDQTISQPYIVALMTELLELKGNEKVLEIGTGSGYQAAILAELVKEVYTIEIFPELAETAKKTLDSLGYKNIKVKYGDGYAGWQEYSPFDAVIVTCAPEDIPYPLISQLAEGGKMVVPVGKYWQELKLIKKVKGQIEVNNVIPVRFVPMLRGKDIKGFKETELDGGKVMLENLKKHTMVLSHNIGERNYARHQNLEQAANYIKQEFLNYGYKNIEEQVYLLEDRPFRNITAVKNGKNPDDEIIVICAHYDSVVGSPGADDNASGVAGLLELARLFIGENNNKIIKFVALTNEEPPFFMTDDMGSFRYAKESKEKGEKIKHVLCLESIGYYSEKENSQDYPVGLGLFYPDRGNFIAFVSNFQSRDTLKKTFKEFKKYSDLPVESLIGPYSLVPSIGLSDHASFWKFGYSAIMITDTAFYRTPYYHTHEDTFEKLDYEKMKKLVDGLHKVILTLDK